jgi:hypothetical protein
MIGSGSTDKDKFLGLCQFWDSEYDIGEYWAEIDL